MRALIHENRVVDVQEVDFEVHPDFVWIDCPDTVEIGDSYDGENFASYKPSEEDVAAAAAAIVAKEQAKASSYQKLIDLGLTEAEAEAIVRYTPPSE